MVLDEVLSRIRPMMPELEQLGVLDLRVFGSVARGTTRDSSDVDFLVRLAKPDYALYFEVRTRLAEILSCPVDLVMIESLSHRYRQSVLDEAVHVA